MRRIWEIQLINRERPRKRGEESTEETSNTELINFPTEEHHRAHHSFGENMDDVCLFRIQCLEERVSRLESEKMIRLDKALRKFVAGLRRQDES